MSNSAQWKSNIQVKQQWENSFLMGGWGFYCSLHNCSCQRRRRSSATASCPSSTNWSVSIASQRFSSVLQPCSVWLQPSLSQDGGPATSFCWRHYLDTAFHSIQRTSARVGLDSWRSQVNWKSRDIWLSISMAVTLGCLGNVRMDHCLWLCIHVISSYSYSYWLQFGFFFWLTFWLIVK